LGRMPHEPDNPLLGETKPVRAELSRPCIRGSSQEAPSPRPLQRSASLRERPERDQVEGWERKSVDRAEAWASRKLYELIRAGRIRNAKVVDVMSAEFVGDACEKFGVDHNKWKDHLWEMVRMNGRRKLREIGPLRAAIRELGGG